MFGCTPDQIRSRYTKNIATLEAICAESQRLPCGIKYRGFTASQWREKTDAFKATAKAVCAS